MPSNQFLRNKKQVFVKLKLINGSEELTSVVIYEDQSSEDIRKIFMLKCDITDFRLILKLRNKRGSVVPLSYQSFEASSREEPFTLEAVQPHATVPLTSRSVNNDATYSIEDRVRGISDRVALLEKAIVELPERRREKINDDLVQISGQVSFLLQKMDKTTSSHWKGMFQKNPLW